jgi:hypothetical protein
MVSPLGKVHFCAVLGGNAITGDGSGGAAFKLTMANNRASAKNFATEMRYITQICNDEARMTNDEGNVNDEAGKEPNASVDLFIIRASTSIRHSSFGFRHLFAARATPSIRGLRPQHHLFDVAGLGAGNCAAGLPFAGFAGANGFTNASSKS